MKTKGKVAQADWHGTRASSYHQFLKRRKRRLERHKANLDPEAPATYTKYSGWES